VLLGHLPLGRHRLVFDLRDGVAERERRERFLIDQAARRGRGRRKKGGKT
jgi:hypothetical protein